jgi:DNA-binding transcriptional regulator YiaG
MTGAELRAARAALGLTQGALASAIGMGRRMVQYWEVDKHPIPEPVARIVRASLIDRSVLQRIALAGLVA